MNRIDKQTLLIEIQKLLTAELEQIIQSAVAAHEAATHAESKAEDRHDTRGLEASYLAGAQANRAKELERLIHLFKFFKPLHYRPESVIGPGALIELKQNNKSSFYFLVPKGGGLSVQFEEKVIRVITSESPLGEALLDQKVGNTIEVENGNQVREYLIVNIE